MAIRFASLSKPAEAMPTNAARSLARAAVDLADVHRRDDAAGDRRARRVDLLRRSRARARGRCRARPGERPSTAPGTSRSASATTPIMPSPLSTTTCLARARGGHGQLARVLQVARVDATHLQPVRAQRALGLWRQSRGLAAAGGGIDDQADRSALGHGASVVRGAPAEAEGVARGCSARGGGLGAVAPPPADRRGDRRARRSRRTGRAGCPARGRGRRRAARRARRCRGRSRAARRSARRSRGCRGRARGCRRRRGDQQAHRAQREHLATAGRRLAEPLDGALEVAGAPFGERQRGVGHAPQLHPLLRAGGGDRPLEVAAGLLGVEALGRAGAEDRKRRGLVFGLGLELLVGALLERLDRLETAALLDPDLPLLWEPSAVILRFAGRSRGGSPGEARAVVPRSLAGPRRRYARRVFAHRRSARHACASRLLLAVVLALSLAGPTTSAALAAGVTTSSGPGSAAAAGAQKTNPEGANGGAFNELSQGAQQETTPTTTATETNGTTTSHDDQLEKTVICSRSGGDRAARRDRLRDRARCAQDGAGRRRRRWPKRARRTTRRRRCASAAPKPRPRASSANETASALTRHCRRAGRRRAPGPSGDQCETRTRRCSCEAMRTRRGEGGGDEPCGPRRGRRGNGPEGSGRRGRGSSGPAGSAREPPSSSAAVGRRQPCSSRRRCGTGSTASARRSGA